MTSRSLLWVRLAVTWLCGFITSGFMPGVALFIPMLAKQGAFAFACEADRSPCDDQELMISSFINTGFLVIIAMTLPVGLFFDRYGGYACGILGASLVTASSILLGAALCVGISSGALFLVLVMLSDIGTFVTGYSFVSFIWHFPQHQTFVLSLQTSSYYASAALPVIFEAIILNTDLSLGSVLIAHGVVCCLCLLGFMWALPSQAEYFTEAKAVLGLPLPPSPEKLDFNEAINGATRTLRVHTRHHCEFIVACVFAIAATLFFQTHSNVIGRSLFGTDGAGQVFIVITVVANIIIGMMVSPFIGGLADAKGLPVAMFTLGASLLLTLLTFYRSWFVASIVIFSNQFFLGVSPAIMKKHFVQYATPQRLGSVISLVMAIAGMLRVFVVGLLSSIVVGDLHFMYVVEIASAIGALLWCACAWSYSKTNPPSSVVLLENDEAELAKSFPGCKSLDDIMFLTGYPQKATLLQKLTSSRLEDFAEVVGRVDEQKVVTLLDRLTTDEFLEQFADDQASGNQSIDGEGLDLEAAFLRTENGGSAKEKPETIEMPLLKDIGDPASPPASGATYKPKLPMLLGHLGRNPSLTAAAEKERSSKQSAEAPALSLLTDGADGTSERLQAMVLECLRKQDLPAFNYLLLTEDVELLTAVWRRFEQQDDHDLERQLNTMLPPRQIADVLRKRPELKPLAIEATKQSVKKKSKYMRASLLAQQS